MRMMYRDTVLIAAHAGCDWRTVDRAYSGKPTRRMVRERIVEAAQQLGLPAPPPVEPTSKDKV